MYTQLKKRYFISLLEKISENKKIYEFTIAMHSRGRENDVQKSPIFKFTKIDSDVLNVVYSYSRPSFRI